MSEQTAREYHLSNCECFCHNHRLLPCTRCELAIVESAAFAALAVDRAVAAEAQARELQTERSKLSAIVAHWQKFAARLAKTLGCCSMDDDIEKAARQLQAQVRELTEALPLITRNINEWVHANVKLYHPQVEYWPGFSQLDVIVQLTLGNPEYIKLFPEEYAALARKETP